MGRMHHKFVLNTFRMRAVVSAVLRSPNVCTCATVVVCRVCVYVCDCVDFQWVKYNGALLYGCYRKQTSHRSHSIHAHTQSSRAHSSTQAQGEKYKRAVRTHSTAHRENMSRQQKNGKQKSYTTNERNINSFEFILAARTSAGCVNRHARTHTHTLSQALKQCVAAQIQGKQIRLVAAVSTLRIASRMYAMCLVRTQFRLSRCANAHVAFVWMFPFLLGALRKVLSIGLWMCWCVRLLFNTLRPRRCMYVRSPV